MNNPNNRKTEIKVMVRKTPQICTDCSDSIYEELLHKTHFVITPLNHSDVVLDIHHHQSEPRFCYTRSGQN